MEFIASLRRPPARTATADCRWAQVRHVIGRDDWGAETGRLGRAGNQGPRQNFRVSGVGPESAPGLATAHSLGLPPDRATADLQGTRACPQADDCVTLRWPDVCPRRAEGRPRWRPACPSGARRPSEKHGAAGRSPRLRRSCRAPSRSPAVPVTGQPSSLCCRVGVGPQDSGPGPRRRPGFLHPGLPPTSNRVARITACCRSLPMGPMPQAAEETLETAAHTECADADHGRDRNPHDHVCLRCADPQRLSGGRGPAERAFTHAGPDIGSGRHRNGRH